MKQSLFETNYQTLERIYLAKNRWLKNNSSWVKKIERSTNSAASNRYKQQQKATHYNNTIDSKLSRPQTSLKFKQSTKNSIKSFKNSNGVAPSKIQQCFNRNSYDKTIYKSQNTKENLQVVRKIIQRLKSENNGIVYKNQEKKKDYQKQKQYHLENYKSVSQIQNDEQLQLKPSLLRFKHYYYTFQKKKTTQFSKNIIKIDQIQKITRDTSISISQMRDYNIVNENSRFTKIRIDQQPIIEEKSKDNHQIGIHSNLSQHQNYKDILQYQSYFENEDQ